MAGDPPLAYFITWTVYGTFLQGDARGWRRRGAGIQPPQPRLAEWRQDRLRHSIVLLTPEQRGVVAAEAERLSRFRQWQLWAVAARTNHVHVVVTAAHHSGDVVRDQLKANCTRVLRTDWPLFQDRPVWTTGGDWRCINSEDDLEHAIAYVNDAQDRKDRDEV